MGATEKLAMVKWQEAYSPDKRIGAKETFSLKPTTSPLAFIRVRRIEDHLPVLLKQAESEGRPRLRAFLAKIERYHKAALVAHRDHQTPDVTNSCPEIG